ncbi:hypothetical protein [Nostoc sp.]|uniref:hypothetical protein n=1 Tax=Nostoc sp. TaxID=1180 RepID=UPI002FF63945
MKKDVAAIARSHFVDGLFLTVLNSMNALLDTSNLLQKALLQEGEKGKGTIQNLFPFPFALFPTYARSLSNELDTGKCQTKYKVYRKIPNSNHDSTTN